MNIAPRQINVIRPFDINRKIEVYRNLQTKLWSVRQDGLVIIHCDTIWLKNAKFIIQPAGQKRVRQEKVKHVHAFVRGFMCNAEDVRNAENSILKNEDDYLDYSNVYYDPYVCDTFEDKDTGLEIRESDFVDMDINSESKVIAIWKTLAKELK